MSPISIAPTIPDRWNQMRFRYIASTSKGRLPVKGDDDANSESLPYLSMEYLRGDTDASTYVSSEGMITADDQDVLLLWDGSNAGEFLRAKLGAVSSTAALVRPIQFDRKFLFWLCKASEPVLKTFTNGMGIPHVDGEFLKDLVLPYPKDAETQERIAKYLDRETARIDRLIAEKERMLALLGEKRAALISRVVTHGLNPNTPLKRSDQEWLGEIPAHWPTTKFSWDVFISEGHVDPEDDNFSEMILIAPNHIESRTGQVIYKETSADQGAISGKYLCREGDVLYSKIRPALRKVALAEQDCLCSADMYALRPSERLLPQYLQYFLLSEDFSMWAELESARVAMPKINRETLSAIRIPVPPLQEQEHIISEISKGTGRIDLQRRAIRGSVNLLKERRAALISAAVTGQIPLEEMT
ncbi:restriction endonuclease subunit S [Acidithiobacillus sp. IBUN Pt1247-S3]|uniref:restriction endonuclease subunit S n=1 Tax=Acidithiobacillus sp. IBUN Pt1247-S3 TaxID=3166642 RepID=UPI0034E4AB93